MNYLVVVVGNEQSKYVEYGPTKKGTKCPVNAANASKYQIVRAAVCQNIYVIHPFRDKKDDDQNLRCHLAICNYVGVLHS